MAPGHLLEAWTDDDETDRGVLDRLADSAYPPADRAVDPAAAERARLLAECELYRMEAELLMDRMCVQSGWRALDLGCGPLGVLDVLWERIGPRGCPPGSTSRRRCSTPHGRSSRRAGCTASSSFTATSPTPGAPPAPSTWRTRG